MSMLLWIFLVIHLGYYVFLFTRLSTYKSHGAHVSKTPLSMVVCFHNEEKNIDKNLKYLLDQKCDEYIFVDDASDDMTLKKLRSVKDDRVKVISSTQKSAGKKNALATGINSTTHNQILLTDADCRPSSGKWAAKMNENPYDFVLGYGPMEKNKGFVCTFSRYETYMTALQYMSYALGGIPYMGVGRNMKISKKMILEEQSKIKGRHLQSGDDDLMVNAVCTRNNTGICIDPDTFVYSDPKEKISDFLHQKARHITTSVYYRPVHQLLLGLFSLSQMGFYMVLIYGLVTGAISLKILALALTVKLLTQAVVHLGAMRNLHETDLWIKAFVFDGILALYYFVLPFYTILKKNKNWK